MKTSREILFDLYRRLYENRAVIPNAPAMTIVPTTVEDFDMTRGRQEVKKLISYLLGIDDIESLSFDDGIQLVDSYQEQPFWRELVVAWFDFVVTEESEAIEIERHQLKSEMSDWIDFLDARDELKKAYIRGIANAVRSGGFHVNGEMLAKNYVKMFLTDEDKALQTLENNPAFFAPIQTHDASGKQILTQKEAMKENKKLGKFLISLKIDLKAHFN